jgi:hypothetical protein
LVAYFSYDLYIRHENFGQMRCLARGHRDLEAEVEYKGRKLSAVTYQCSVLSLQAEKFPKYT